MEVEQKLPKEAYRYLHTLSGLKLTWWDRVKIMFGLNPVVGLCVRLVIYKTEDNKFEDVSFDYYSTSAIVNSADEELPTSEAIFDYKKLHKVKE